MAWAALLGRVGTELTRALAVALGAPEDHFDGAFAGEPHWFGKLIRYVGQDVRRPGRPRRRAARRLGLPHPAAPGRHRRPAGPAAARRPSGSTCPPLDGALVINVGEMLEVATDGYLVATDHRVLPCAPGATRQSIGIFWSPRLDATLDALPLPPELAARGAGRLPARAQRAAAPLRRQRPQGLAPLAPRGGRAPPPGPRRRGLTCASSTTGRPTSTASVRCSRSPGPRS